LSAPGAGQAETVAVTIEVGLVGDHDGSITAHRAIPVALQLAGEALGIVARPRWLATDSLDAGTDFGVFDALWCVPGSPYRRMDGALAAIRFARERGLPFLGTCGGFQHAVIEIARHVLGWADAEHAETAPDAPRAVIHLLECGLVEARERLGPVPGSRLSMAYCGQTFEEGYRCRYGLNPRFADALFGGAAGLQACAFGPEGDARAAELEGHPFFVATLFQPERAALEGRVPPLVQALLAAAIEEKRECC